MKLAQTYRVGSIATRTMDSTLRKPKSTLSGRTQRLCLAILACALALGATSSAKAADARDQAAIRALGDGFANAFLEKNAEARASLFAENGTFLTPDGHFLQGHTAMVSEFGPEAEHAVNGSTQAAFSNYRIRFINPDVAVTDAVLTVRNVTGPDGTIVPVIPISVFYVAARHGDKWLIEDGRAHFAPAPTNSMTSQN
jgi:uncharacterized protein (TIGR02246 family)